MDNSYLELLPIELITVILFYVDDLLPIISLNYKISNQVLSTKEFFIGKLDINNIKLKRDSFIYNSLTNDPSTNINIYNRVDKLYNKLIKGTVMAPMPNLTYDNFKKLNIDKKIRDSLIKLYSDSSARYASIFSDITGHEIYIYTY